MAVALLRWVVENEETPAVSVTSLRHIVTASQRRTSSKPRRRDDVKGE